MIIPAITPLDIHNDYPLIKRGKLEKSAINRGFSGKIIELLLADFSIAMFDYRKANHKKWESFIWEELDLT
jgi:hypothetical protein